jgi:hypothetical protein
MSVDVEDVVSGSWQFAVEMKRRKMISEKFMSKVLLLR